MKRIFLAWLFAIVQVVTPAYAGTQAIVRADLVDGIDTIKNYAGANSHFEKNVNNWVRYDDTTAVPTSCNTLSGLNNTFARSTSSPLSGDASGLWTKSGGTSRIGEGLALPFTIDAKDKGAVLKVQFDYEVSANYADDDVRVWVYDVTNSRLIEPSPNYVKDTLVASSIQPFEFQTSIDSTSYRLCIHQASASALDYTVKIDNVKIGKSAASSGPFISDWQSYTPTGTWVTNTTYTGMWRRVGDSAEYQFTAITSGAPTAANLAFNLPSGHTIDTTKMALGANGSFVGSFGSVRDAGSGSYAATAYYLSTTSVQARILPSSGTYATIDNVTATVPITFGASDSVQINFSVPIVGWGSNQKLSSDAETRVVAAEIRTASQAISAATWTLLQGPTITNDTHGTWSTTNNYATIKVSGWYRLSAVIDMTAGASETYFGYTKNDATIANAGNNRLGGGAGAYTYSGTLISYFNAGDIIRFGVYLVTARTLSTTGQISIEMIQGPQQIAASETVAALGRRGSAQSIPNNTPTLMALTSEDFDSHGGLATTGTFTAPVSGLYLVSGAASFIANGTGIRSVDIYKNGSVYAKGITRPQEANLARVSVTSLVRLLAGETVSLYVSQNSGSALSLNSNSDENYMSVARIGL